MTGRITGLHPGVTPAMLAYATMEGVAFQFADCVAAQVEVGARPERFNRGRRRHPQRALAAAIGHRA